MVPWPLLVLPVAGLSLGVVGGVFYAWLFEQRAARGAAAVDRGRAVTVPMLVSVNGGARRGAAVTDGDVVRVLARGTHVVVRREDFLSAAVRRPRADDDLLLFAEQRGFVDAAGTRHLLGPVEEWEDTFLASLRQPPRPASRWRLLLAAVPRQVLAPLALAFLGLGLFQVVWASGHDVRATMVRVVGEEGLESCGVRWHEQGRGEYAEVDCYPPFPKTGDSVPVRALAWPFDRSAMDTEDTYLIASVLLGGTAVLLLGAAVGVGWSRVRRSPVRLAPLRAPAGAIVVAPRPVVELDRGAALADLIAAVAEREAWETGGPAAAPVQPWYARYLMALGAGTWWPGMALAGLGVLPEGLPRAWRLALGAGAVVALGWAAFRALTAWLTIRRAYRGPVTSEWDYRLVRSVDDEWHALLFLGSTPHWIVVIDGPGHPAPIGRCGIRGDLVPGGAVQLLVDGSFWPTLSPVDRVDAELVNDLREDLLDRLGEATARPDRA